MARIFHIIDSFTSGRLSPRLRGRVDLDQYNNGVRTLDNFTIHPHGGVTRRTGTKYIAEVKDSSAEVRLIPFQFSTTQAYILEFGNQYIRFFKDQGQILDSEAITNGTFDTDLTGWTDNSSGTGATAQSSGAAQLTGAGAGNEARLYQSLTLGTNQYTITVTTSAALTYNIGTTVGGTEIATGSVNGTAQTISFTPSTHGAVYIEFENPNNDARTFDDVSINTPIYQIDSPYTTAQLETIQFAQSADVLYIVHGLHEPRKLTRTGHDDWTLEVVDFIDGPYYDATHKTYGGIGADFTINPSGTTGAITLTAASDLFVSTDVGRLVRFRSSSSATWGWAKITGYTSATVVNATVEKDFDAASASKEWRLGQWSDTTGFPQTVTFHEQRLCFASTSDLPQTLWGSTSGSIEDFQPDNSDYKDAVDDDTAYTYTIAATEANVIHWLNSRQSLFLGTSGNIFEASASSNSEAITPSNIVIKQAVGVDCKKSRPITTQNATIFTHFFGKKLMELGFSFEEDSYQAIDITLLSEDIAGTSAIKYIAKQEEPDNIIWACLDDGSLIGITYLKQQKVAGWHTHTIGGTGVEIESIATIPGSSQTELWLSIKRTINGSTKRYIEVLTELFDGTKADMWFVDSGLSFTASETDTITGITQANPAVVTTSGAHGLSNGDKVKITGVVGMTELNGFTFKVANKTSTTFELLNTDSTNYTAYSSGGTVLYLPITLSGLDHLEGETVTLLINQATHPTKVVSGGSVTLEVAAEEAVIGLGYNSILETNVLEVRGQKGTAQGSQSRIHQVILRFYDTIGGKFGPDADNLDIIAFREGSDNMDSSPGLFTGDKILDFPSGYDTQTRVYVKHDQPLPMTLLSIVSKVEIADN